MKIAIDFDGTLANTLELWVTAFHDELGLEPPVGSALVKEYDFWKDYNITHEQFLGVVDSVVDSGKLKSAAPTDMNFVTWWRMMEAEGHELFILTANDERAEKDIAYFMSKYGIDCRIVCAGTQPKARFQWDVLVDDKPIAHLPDDREQVIFNQPWNEDFETKRRVYNFEGVYKYINVKTFFP